MKRTIQIEIETDESGRYCGECLYSGITPYCGLYDVRKGVYGKYERCAACIAAEYTEPFFSGYLRKTKDGVMTISRKEKP